MRHARLDEAQAGIKIAWRNINDIRFTDDTTFMAENKVPHVTCRADDAQAGIYIERRNINNPIAL